MNGILVDSCVLLDLFTNDLNWANWSEGILDKYGQTNTLFINSIIYTEVSIGFNRIEEVEAVLEQAGIKVLEIPRDISRFRTYFPDLQLISPFRPL